VLRLWLAASVLVSASAVGAADGVVEVDHLRALAGGVALPVNDA
jgi:hypothetical protein